jgi:hypothetical protein
MTKHMTQLIKVRNGNKDILAKFGKLSPSKLIIRIYVVKRRKLINMGKSS